MRSIITYVGTALLLAIASRLAAESAPTLTVRLYNTSGIPSPELLTARLSAERLLRDTGLNVVVRQCGEPTPDRGSALCDDPLGPSEVVVRLINAPAFNTALHPEVYGVTYVLRDSNRGWLATVFSDRIRAAAARVAVEPGTLLGRVMAHEVGHLLLGTDYHGDAGLMRAEWPDALLARAAEDWHFSTVEAVRMHRVLRSMTDVAATRPPL